MTDNKKYRILCLGEFCLPRVITTMCGLKPRKADGEKTCPFDLAFFLDFNWILDFIDTNFFKFFDGVEYDYVQSVKLKTDLFRNFRNKLYGKAWKNEQASVYFIHESTIVDKDEFVKIYKRRIENLYEYLNDKDKKLYNVIASFEPITQKQINRLNSIIERYRPKESFRNIIIDLSKTKTKLISDNTYIINFNDDEYRDIFKYYWVKVLEDHTTWDNSDRFYNKLTKELNKIIK